MIYRGLSSWMKFIELVSERKRENNRDACSIPIVIPIGGGGIGSSSTRELYTFWGSLSSVFPVLMKFETDNFRWLLRD